MTDSLPVHSNQDGQHPDLEDTVRKHLRTPFQRPLPDWVQSLVDELLAWVADRPLILDSGCGTGLSTLQIAQHHPDCAVVGIDQSQLRLQRFAGDGDTGQPVSNLRLMRADVQDVWRALQQRQANLHAHYLLYPNPWPKAHHLMRRWHGHPVWPSLLALGGELELRTNWDIYAQEFVQALQVSGFAEASLSAIDRNQAVAQPMSLFEKKYALSQHGLWRVSVALTRQTIIQP